LRRHLEVWINLKKNLLLALGFLELQVIMPLILFAKKKLETLSITSAYTDEGGEDVGLDIKDDSLDPQEEAIKSQKTEIMLNIVNKLPVKYQRLVDLRFFQELSYEEISERINIPLGTVKAQLHRAKELLYDLIGNRKDLIT
jgi:RNA polymerase sigma-70 factor (ECF subfamily)